MNSLLHDPVTLKQHITRLLYEQSLNSPIFTDRISTLTNPSAVLLLLGAACARNGFQPAPCLILNKRSRFVRQPGDLCCPGGSVSPRADALLARLITLPGGPMRRWPYWPVWHRKHPRQARRLALLLATGLREGLEEMRLNPLGVEFLGPMPPQHLRIFRRVIYPMTGWVVRQKRFLPNWEVERLVHIPLSYLLHAENYARYRIRFSPNVQERVGREIEDFPCIVYNDNGEREFLWGATYRIVSAFLSLVFHFEPPDLNELPVVSTTLRGSYLGGKRKE